MVLSSSTIIKLKLKNKLYLIDLEKNPTYIKDFYPDWINNYNKILSDENYYFLIKKAMTIHTTDKNLYIWDAKAHLKFDFSNFFLDLVYNENLILVFFFIFSISINICILWSLFLCAQQIFFKFTKSFSFLMEYIKENIFFFVFLLISTFLTQGLILKHDLITCYPEEWSLALIILLIVFFIDLLWGFILLDFKIVLKNKYAFLFFKGLHFEFLFFIVMFLFVITFALNSFNLIECAGKNEFWTKWD